ncbi:hypothetical protein HEP_00535800, partial [Hepatocystis sp. ex Piliocolobus tephrosceles]
MDNNYFIQTFENVNERTLPSPLIKHSKECINFNNKRKSKNRTYKKQSNNKPKTEVVETGGENPENGENENRKSGVSENRENGESENREKGESENREKGERE